jgi:hypothetical protein
MIVNFRAGELLFVSTGKEADLQPGGEFLGEKGGGRVSAGDWVELVADFWRCIYTRIDCDGNFVRACSHTHTRMDEYAHLELFLASLSSFYLHY